MIRKVYIRKLGARWTWWCLLCQPPCCGSTSSFGATRRHVIRHCERSRPFHHMWVLARFGRLSG